ncbi:MAG: hypothetical protein IPN77_32770 [Sandaracinaceae bacterium]|nr:hypothetical protein [Sandaracinaceae bacterium]
MSYALISLFDPQPLRVVRVGVTQPAPLGWLIERVDERTSCGARAGRRLPGAAPHHAFIDEGARAGVSCGGARKAQHVDR